MQSVQHHSKPIDLDSRVLQLPIESGKRRARHTLSLPELYKQLVGQLQTTLEAERLFAFLFETARELVPLDSLHYRHEPTDLHIRLGDEGLHYASYRLTHHNERLGEIVFRRGQRFVERELQQLETLLSGLMYPLRNALLYRHAILEALRDPLTGASNRVAMNRALAREVEHAQRSGRPLACLMLDVDHFKRINDQYGHQCGDETLKRVAAQLKSHVANTDLLFRFGGEEFLILLPGTELQAAADLGERLRQAVETMSVPAGDDPLMLTVSLGGASLHPEESSDDLLRRTDGALYAAKRGGRNRLCLAS